MSLGAHLVELRNRIFVSAIAILLGVVGGWFLTDWVWDALRQPVEDLGDRVAQITYSDIGSGFDLRLQIALFIGVLFASPVWLYQIWAFFAPGLTRREKGYAFGFLGIAIPLFLGGVYAGWSVLPNIVHMMAGFQPSEDAFQLNARTYLDFAVKLMLAVGIGFVMPVFLVMLNFLGVLRGATILKNWRIAIVAIVLFAGITTPATELMTMFMLSGPIALLYFAAAGIAILRDRRVDARRNAELAEYELADDGADQHSSRGGS